MPIFECLLKNIIKSLILCYFVTEVDKIKFVLVFPVSPEPHYSKFYDYEGFMKNQIEKKKHDNTYREFKKITRRASDFPLATNDMNGRDVTVWCSNDYLGMSWHPKVQAAVVLVHHLVRPL